MERTSNILNGMMMMNDDVRIVVLDQRAELDFDSSNRKSNPRFTTLEASTTITPPMRIVSILIFRWPCVLSNI